MSFNKEIQVSCAIIVDRNGLIMAARRGAAMNMPMKWEFPGGKIEADESAASCLLREIREELNLQIKIEQELPVFSHDYPKFRINLHPFVCTIIAGELILQEHESVEWLACTELHRLDWAAADLPIVEFLSAGRLS